MILESTSTNSLRMCCRSQTSSRLDYLGFGGGLALKFDADQRFCMFPMLTVISRDTSILLYLPLRESIVEQPSNLLNLRRFDRPQRSRVLAYFYSFRASYILQRALSQSSCILKLLESTDLYKKSKRVQDVFPRYLIEREHDSKSRLI